jgi:K+-transporting ATPase ATPase C chain
MAASTSLALDSNPAPSIAALLRTALGMLAVLTLITGVLYPLLVTVVANVGFHDQATGSMIRRDGRIQGSALIGQPFEDPKYFWGRSSATSPSPYNGGASAGSNLGPTNEALTKSAKARIESLRAVDPGNTAPVPVDLVTSSGSGLDPHISPAAAEYQVARIARMRGVPETNVRELVHAHTEERTLGVLGEPRVNVLLLNLALDRR